MPARKIVVHRKKTVSHRKPMRRPAPKMLPAATTTAIVNKVLMKNGIRPGTPTHKKLLPSLKSFAVRHQKKLLAATHAGAFAAGAAAGHYGTKQVAGKSGLARLRAFTHTNHYPEWLIAPKRKISSIPGLVNRNDRSVWQRFKNARGWKAANKA